MSSKKLCCFPQITTRKCLKNFKIPVLVLVTKDIKRCLMVVFKSHEVAFNSMVGNQFLDELCFSKGAFRMFKTCNKTAFSTIKNIITRGDEQFFIKAIGWDQLHLNSPLHCLYYNNNTELRFVKQFFASFR